MDVYERLAVKLDNMPNGFPRTESGEEIRILRMIFHPEEAEIVIQMSPLPETAAAIAERVGKPVEEMQLFLDRMARRGLVDQRTIKGERVYYAVPFIVGIYEGQRNTLDAELAEAGQRYIHTFMAALGKVGPAYGQILPVGIEVPSETKIHTSNDIRKMFDDAVVFNLKDCICRKGMRLLGHDCRRPTKEGKPVGCLAISRDPNAFTGPGAAVLGKNVTREEALKVLAEAEAAGCVHATFNVDIENWVTLPICNCCDCCCEFLKAYNKSDTPQMYAKDHVACIDPDACIACGVCKDERCPVRAIADDDGVYTIIEERCIGCGACTIACPVVAISIEKRDGGKKPANKVEWMAARAKSRDKGFPA